MVFCVMQGSEVRQVFLDCLFDFLVVPRLINGAFAV